MAHLWENPVKNVIIWRLSRLLVRTFMMRLPDQPVLGSDYRAPGDAKRCDKEKQRGREVRGIS